MKSRMRRPLRIGGMGLVEISDHCKQRPTGGHESKQNPGNKNAVNGHFSTPNCTEADCIRSRARGLAFGRLKTRCQPLLPAINFPIFESPADIRKDAPISCLDGTHTKPW